MVVPSYRHVLPLTLCALALGVASSPVHNSGPLRGGVRVKLNRRAARQTTVLHNGDVIHLFDPTHAIQELDAILSKYSQAAQFLQGVGLNSEQIDVAQFYEPSGFDTSSDVQSPSLPHVLYPFSNISTTSTTSSSPSGAASIDPSSSAEDAGAEDAGDADEEDLGMGTGIEPLQDFAPGNVDLLYYGPVDIGTPAQGLTIDIDTGSADLWVPVNCTSCNGRSFDPAQSSTYTNTNQPFSITYGSGAVSGTLATDVVSVAGFTVQQQAFGAIDGESADFQGRPNDGLLGMAFGTIAQSRRPTFFENLIEERQLVAPLFSVHLERQKETGSEVCFGCVDADRIDGTGSITWVPVKSKTYWAIGMDGIAANGQVAQTNILAAIDTGTTLIYLPNELAARFYALVPGSKLAAQFGPGFYTYPCASRPAVELSFDGTRFALDLRDFNLGRTALGSADCVGGILAAGDGFPSNLAIVGDEFLKSWYSIYDYSNGARVGFAQDANNRS